LSRYGQQDDFYRFLLEALPFLKFIRNTRNCVEHPKADKRLVIQDFAVEPNGAVVAPTIEVVHPDTPHAPVLISEFIRGTHERIVTIVESSIALMCSREVRSVAGFEVRVVELTEDKRVNHVRYAYGLFDREGRMIGPLQ
jgi:hypothetical protein